NWERIFPTDTTKHPADTTATGWGDWIVLHGVKVHDGDVTVRLPWKPDSALSRAARDSAIRVTLDTTTVTPRLRVLRIPAGFQQVQVYHHMSGVFPLVQIAKQHDKTRRIQVQTLQLAAYPFRRPG